MPSTAAGIRGGGVPPGEALHPRAEDAGLELARDMLDGQSCPHAVACLVERWREANDGHLAGRHREDAAADAGLAWQASWLDTESYGGSPLALARRRLRTHGLICNDPPRLAPTPCSVAETHMVMPHLMRRPAPRSSRQMCDAVLEMQRHNLTLPRVSNRTGRRRGTGRRRKRGSGTRRLSPALSARCGSWPGRCRRTRGLRR